MKAELLVDAAASLGEGPVWDGARGVLWWVDIDRGEVHRCDSSGIDEVVKRVPDVSCLTPTRDGRLFLCAGLRYGMLDPESGELEWSGALSESSTVRFNDGKCDPAGRFWAGTMDRSVQQPIGKLYRFDRQSENGDPQVTEVLPGVTVSNGMAWALDGTSLYYIDTPRFSVDQFSLDMNSGTLSDRRSAVRIPADLGRPDGMTIDCEGKLWVAHWDGHGVSRFDPQSGELLKRVTIPSARVTSCMFGGEGLRTLYVTTAAHGATPEELERYPHSGGIFMIRMKDEFPHIVRGVPEALRW
jgi:sugar lactone lactonase YvrE